MSTLATEQRRTRRAWAVAGSSHDRLIGFLRIALPTAIGMLAAFLAVAPLTVGRDISFVLSKNSVDMATERMRMAKAVYRGRDEKGEPFELTAASGVQQSSRDPIVHLQTLKARIQLADGPATIVAQRGRYDMDSERIAIDGPVRLDDAGGYHVLTRDVLVDLNSRLVGSRGPVDGTMTLGTFRADHLRANLNTNVLNLDGHARLHIVQGQSRGAR